MCERANGQGSVRRQLPLQFVKPTALSSDRNPATSWDCDGRMGWVGPDFRGQAILSVLSEFTAIMRT